MRFPSISTSTRVAILSCNSRQEFTRTGRTSRTFFKPRTTSPQHSSVTFRIACTGPERGASKIPSAIPKLHLDSRPPVLSATLATAQHERRTLYTHRHRQPHDPLQHRLGPAGILRRGGSVVIRTATTEPRDCQHRRRAAFLVQLGAQIQLAPPRPWHGHWTKGPRYAAIFILRPHDEPELVDGEGNHLTAGQWLYRKFSGYRTSHEEQATTAGIDR
jgi:hypothetical protein